MTVTKLKDYLWQTVMLLFFLHSICAEYVAVKQTADGTIIYCVLHQILKIFYLSQDFFK